MHIYNEENETKRQLPLRLDLRGVGEEKDSIFFLFEYNNNILYFASYKCHAFFIFHSGFLSLSLCYYYRLYYFIYLYFLSFFFSLITVIGFVII